MEQDEMYIYQNIPNPKNACAVCVGELHNKHTNRLISVALTLAIHPPKFSILCTIQQMIGAYFLM
jgi:hypothetical protein